MKKILTIAASLAIVAGLASCQKENVGENSGNSEQVTITATFADQTKVAYAESGNNLQPAWEVGDTIVGICGSNPFELKVKSLTGNVANLVANEGSNIPEGTVTLFYKSGLKKENWDGTKNQFVVSLNSQKGDKTMPAIMCATGTIAGASGNFMFENSGAVLGIYEVGSALKNQTIKQVTLYGKKLASSATLDKTNGVKFTPPLGTYNVISTEVLSNITVADDGNGTLSSEILMAVPAEAEVEKVFIRTTEGEVYSLGSSNETPAMAAGVYRYIKGATFERDAKRDDMILTGVFSVQNGEEEPVKQVFFSKGNLQATFNSSAYTWGFAANQYSRIGKAAGNTTIGSQTDGAVVDLFGWVGASSDFNSSPEIYGVSASTTNADYGNSAADTLKADWGTAIDNKGTWRTLSIDEWYYLFDSRNAVCGVTIEDTKYSGVFIYPDNYNGVDVSSMTWNQINAAGIVYLPAAGYRNGSAVTDDNVYGYYWSSTVHSNMNVHYAKLDDDFHDYDDNRKKGCSVRLITECQ